MAERKVLNKYNPPDFDPLELRRSGRPKNRQIKVRTMLSMSIRCDTCGNYIYKGTKFNSRRFYFKCTKCSAELTIKTDPQNSDYVVELGETRNFEPWRERDEAVENEKRKRGAEETGDAMRRLENKALDTKRKMDVLAVLGEMKSMKSRRAAVDVEAMLEVLQRTCAAKEKKLEEEDEALLKSIVFRTSRDFAQKVCQEFPDKPADSSTKANSSVPIVVVRKAAPLYNISAKIEKTKVDKNSGTGLQSSVQNYGSADDD
ncbi:hypothetical protein BT93_L3280 [Corymbia citriodora subsp. variegata]|uniref:Splicing factor YJU2 n=1 Tax=Corymbia citriodora subsp. variegata TaxID=360336 RepID=A0A8T0CK33_CORYI|nr:hypothetical protein BT93_L3280 [Corymbia citriodora subsp. variegata]